MIRRPHTTGLLLCILLLSGCSMLDSATDWFTGTKEKPTLPGKRIAVLNEASQIKADESLANEPVSLPELTPNDAWPQAGGNALGITGNLQLSGLSHEDRVKIGDGNAWEQPLYPSPVVANGMVFAMDAKGYITAHDAKDIGKVRWTNTSAVGKDEPDLLGGGLAFDNGHIYVTTGRGQVIALDAKDGKEIWKQFIGVPLRAAPKAAGGRVYALSVDNQLFALNAEGGATLWNQRGINENAGFLASVSPAITDAIAVAPYSSGEVYALDAGSGQDLWSDSLLLPHRNSATGGFAGIGGNPIVRDDVAYVAGSGGFTAALALQSGRHVWEQNISSLNTPWLAGDFLYLLSAESELVCLKVTDGRIKWIKQLARFENEAKRKNPYVWRGPVMAGGELLVAGAHGQMLALAPKDGATIRTLDIPEDITDAPVVAGGRLYFLTQDARLHVLY